MSLSLIAAGTAEWSDAVQLYAASQPDDPLNLVVTASTTEYVTVSWDVPASSGGCTLEGYSLYVEDVTNPGPVLVYDGSLISTVTSKTIVKPYISSSKEYAITLQAKNCGYYSAGVVLHAYSASAPSQIQEPVIV